MPQHFMSIMEYTLNIKEKEMTLSIKKEIKEVKSGEAYMDEKHEPFSVIYERAVSKIAKTWVSGHTDFLKELMKQKRLNIQRLFLR